MYKLVFFVPVDAVDTVKEAVFAAGAGKIGNYDQCCWQTLGHGQFRPLEGSNPTLGQCHKLESVDEFRVEMVVGERSIKRVVESLRRAHPYEEPAFDVWRTERF